MNFCDRPDEKSQRLRIQGTLTCIRSTSLYSMLHRVDIPVPHPEWRLTRLTADTTSSRSQGRWGADRSRIWLVLAKMKLCGQLSVNLQTETWFKIFTATLLSTVAAMSVDDRRGTAVISPGAHQCAQIEHSYGFVGTSVQN